MGFGSSHEAFLNLLAQSNPLSAHEDSGLDITPNLSEIVFPEEGKESAFRSSRYVARKRKPEEISIYFEQDEPDIRPSIVPSFATRGELSFNPEPSLDEGRAYQVAETAPGTMANPGLFNAQGQDTVASPKTRGLGKPNAQTKTAVESVWDLLTGGIENTADDVDKAIPGVNQGRVQFEINELQVFRNNLASPTARAIIDEAIAQLSTNVMSVGDLAAARALSKRAQEQALAQSRLERESRSEWQTELAMPSMEKGVLSAPSFLPDVLDGEWAAEGGEFPNIHSPSFDIFASRPRGRGERNWTHSADGTKDKFKHLKPDDDDPRMVKRRNSQDGKQDRVVKPKGFDEYWAAEQAKRKKFRR